MQDRGDPTGFSDLDHVGATSTTLLSDALLSARGGIVGYWSLEDLDLSHSPDPLWDRFRKLGPEVRAAILDGILIEGFSYKEGESGYFGGITAPAPLTRADFEGVRRAADLRDDRLNEIYAQQKDILSFFGALFDASGSRYERSIEFIDAVLRLCVTVEMWFKFEFSRPRPVEIAPEVMPIIATPGHGSYPSGHAVESMAVAAILGHFSAAAGRPKIGSQAQALARRIAYNRVIAGVHYESDNGAGETLGAALARYAIEKSKAATGTPLQGLYQAALGEWAKGPG